MEGGMQPAEQNLSGDEGQFRRRRGLRWRRDGAGSVGGCRIEVAVVTCTVELRVCVARWLILKRVPADVGLGRARLLAKWILWLETGEVPCWVDGRSDQGPWVLAMRHRKQGRNSESKEGGGRMGEEMGAVTGWAQRRGGSGSACGGVWSRRNVGATHVLGAETIQRAAAIPRWKLMERAGCRRSLR